MKNSALLPLSLAAALTAAVAIPLFTGPEANAQEAWSGQQWEYRALRISDRNQSTGRNRELGARHSESEDTLNQLGAQGWELVAVRPDGSNEPIFYFKRPKK